MPSIFYVYSAGKKILEIPENGYFVTDVCTLPNAYRKYCSKSSQLQLNPSLMEKITSKKKTNKNTHTELDPNLWDAAPDWLKKHEDVRDKKVYVDDLGNTYVLEYDGEESPYRLHLGYRIKK